jgi:hypothetical protein
MMVAKKYIATLYNMDFQEIIKRTIKYLIEGLAVAIVAMLIPKKPLNVEEIIILALTASASFSILDYFIPAMGDSMRNGAGLGLGFNLVGFGI